MVDSYKKLRKNRNIRELFKTEFFLGLTQEGALDTVITLMIIISFSKDFSLGVITSISYIFSILSAYLCKKIKTKNNKDIIYLSCIIPLISTIILLIVTNKYTIIAYNIIYTFFFQIISIIKNIKTLKITNSIIINDSNRVETFIILEFYLGSGRLVSYLFLLVVGLLNNMFLLKVLVIILSICILLMGKILVKIHDD